jgi:hypothetical protein
MIQNVSSQQKRKIRLASRKRDKQIMKKITSALVAITMTLGLAGLSFAQNAPAPDTKAPATKTEKKAKKAPKAKKTKKSATATPSK